MQEVYGMEDDELAAFLDLPEANGDTPHTPNNAKTYIHIRNFGRFQRFQDRRPTWIRLHLDLVDNDDFLALTDHQQAVLIQMWISYAKSVSRDAEGNFKIGRSLPQDTTKLGRRLGRRVRKDTVDSLLAAGFLEKLGTEAVTFRDGSGSLELRSKKLEKNYRAREEDQHQRPKPKPKVCPDCEVGGGLHSAECPRVQSAILQVELPERRGHVANIHPIAHTPHQDAPTREAQA